jgi:hypothetical protein
MKDNQLIYHSSWEYWGCKSKGKILKIYFLEDLFDQQFFS